MSQWKFDHLSDKGHLLSATSNVVITDFIELLLILSVNRFSLSKKHSIRGYDTPLLWLCCNYFKLDWLEISSYYEQIALLDWPISVFEIRNQVSFGQVASNTFNGVLQRKDVGFG